MPKRCPIYVILGKYMTEFQAFNMASIANNVDDHANTHKRITLKKYKDTE